MIVAVRETLGTVPLLPLQLLLALTGLALLFAAILVYGSTLSVLVRRGGRVGVGHFSLPDLFTASMLAVSVGAIAARTFVLPQSAAPEVTADKLLPAQLYVIVIVAGIGGFLRWRGLKLGEVFGLRTLPVIAIVGAALLFLLAAFPLVTLTNHLSLLMLRKLAAEQPLVELFRDLARGRDYPAMGQVFLAAVVIAPLCEEFLFRGYFYGVAKRYLGPLAGAFVTSLLFAAIHVNLASLPGLFVLALCLTAAYERTGSLLVPIGMHALYNFSSLLLLYLDAAGKLPLHAP